MEGTHLEISDNALLDALHQPNLVKSEICCASSFLRLLKLISKTSTDLRFLN